MEIGDGERDEFLLVLVVRAVARGVEHARGAVEIALNQERRRDAERGPVRRGIALERALVQRARERCVACQHRHVASSGEIFRIGVVWQVLQPGSHEVALAVDNHLRQLRDRLAARAVGILQWLRHEVPRQRHPRRAHADRRQDPNRQHDGLGHVVRRRDVEFPDARLHRADVPLALRVRRRLVDPGAAERAGGVAIKRFRADAGVRDALTFVGDDASLRAKRGVLRVQTPAGRAG